MRRTLPVLLAAALALSACAGREDGHDDALPGVVPYFADRTAIYPDGAARTLAEVPRPRLRGVDGPAAVGSAGGRIVYSAFDEKVRLDPLRTAGSQGVRDGTVLGRPLVRESGETGDRVLAEGAFAPVVSATGRVAVGLLDDPDQRFGRPHDAAVAVLEPGSATPRRWTPAGGLRTPVAWVGDALLWALPARAGPPELWMATGPDAGRQLVPAGFFVAAAPDRQRVLVAVPDPEREGRLAFEIRSVPYGGILARLPTELRWVGLGSWTARQIVAVGAPAPGTLRALELTGDLRSRGQVDLAVPAELATPPNEISVAADHRSFAVATFVVGTRAPNLTWVLLDCSFTEEACRRTDLRPGVEYLGFISNTSV